MRPSGRRSQSGTYNDGAGAFWIILRPSDREFGPGEAVVEAVDSWHEGEVVGSEPVKLLVIDHVPPGETNVVRR